MGFLRELRFDFNDKWLISFFYSNVKFLDSVRNKIDLIVPAEYIKYILCKLEINANWKLYEDSTFK